MSGPRERGGFELQTDTREGTKMPSENALESAEERVNCLKRRRQRENALV